MQLIEIYRFDSTNFNSITVYTVFFIVKKKCRFGYHKRLLSKTLNNLIGSYLFEQNWEFANVSMSVQFVQINKAPLIK